MRKQRTLLLAAAASASAIFPVERAALMLHAPATPLYAQALAAGHGGSGGGDHGGSGGGQEQAGRCTLARLSDLGS